VTNYHLTFAESALYWASRNNNNRTTEWTTKQRRFAADKSIEINNLQKIKRDSSHPDHFFCLDSKAKKHEAVRLRFMHRRCVSWHVVPLHTFVCLTRLRRARHKVLHKSLTMKHCFRLHFITPRQAAKAPEYEASPFHSDMKHFAYAPYDLSSIALCATDDEKMEKRVYPCAIQRYPHYIMTCNPVLYGWIFLYLDFTQ